MTGNYERYVFLERIMKLEDNIKTLKEENENLKAELERSELDKYQLGNESIVIQKKDLKIILDRLGMKYMTPEANILVHRLINQLRG